MRARHDAGRGALMSLVLVSVSACSAPAHGPESVRVSRNTSPWQYEVTAGPSATDLSIVATFPKGTDPHMTVINSNDPFLVGVQVADGKEWHEERRLGSTWTLDACAKGCRVRYRYLLRDAAATWRDVALGIPEHGAIEAPPSTWLLRPEHAAPGTAIRFHVTTAPGDAFVSGVFAAPGTAPSDGIYEAHVADFMQLPYSAFGALRLHELADGTATVAFLPGALPEADVLAWATASLAAVHGFYGRPTVPHVLILVVPSNGDEVGFGVTMGYSGAAITINVGAVTTPTSFGHDWVLVHELIHTALPDMPDDQHWLEEGLATYIEPLARYRAEGLPLSDVWTEWALKMKLGEPQAGDLGLDTTHTWGRTYWGGALFCLTADVEIRTRTKGKASLEDALRAILAAGGSIAVSWPIEKVLDVGDQATGTTVLHETYEKLAKHPTVVDLPLLWKRLGVVLHGEEAVTFDDSAELAWVRKGMTPAR